MVVSDACQPEYSPYSHFPSRQADKMKGFVGVLRILVNRGPNICDYENTILY